MQNTILSLENNNRTSDFIKKSFLRIAVIGLIVLVPEIIYFIISGNYWLLTTSICVAVFLSFQVWSILVKNHYSTNLTLCIFSPAWVVALIVAFTQGDIVSGLAWTFACITLTYFILPQRKAWLVNGISLAILLPFVWGMLESLEAAQVVLSLLIISIFLAICINVITNQQRDLHLLAATDVLTGLFNRTILYQSLEQAIEQSKRKGLDMTLITLDIDHFKSINDKYGHDVGDDVLRKLGILLKHRVRLSDKAFRVGGEEFLILLFGTNLSESQVLAEELRILVADTKFIKDHPVTISLGLSTLLADEDWTSWVKRGDEYLYIAKARGRNQVVAQDQNSLKDIDLHASLSNLSTYTVSENIFNKQMG